MTGLYRRGVLAEDGWESVADARLPGWQHTGIRVAELADGERLQLAPTGVERLIVPLSGSFTVTHEEKGATTVTTLAGRRSVFDGPTDVLYLSCEATGMLTGEGRVAVATSTTREPHATTHLSAADVPVELRGAGDASRQVHNLGVPGVLDAARLIVCEVITPAGNWSSYPPHKHDEHIPGHETRLEEIYYFEARSAGDGSQEADPFGTFSMRPSPVGGSRLHTEVRTGDIVLVAEGYHGPAGAPPGYELYYLNVMAGPDVRSWLITDDPHHAWVRSTWHDAEVDARLPYGRERNRG